MTETMHASELDPHRAGGTARGYSWPPFEEGNWAALKHGAESPRKIRPLAEQYEAELLELAPWTGRPAFQSARESYAWARAQLILLRVYIDDHGMSRAEVERAHDLTHKLENRITKLRDSLGLTPTSLSKLLASLASVAASGGDSQGLADVKREGAEIVRAREAQLGQGEGSDGV